MVNFPTQFFSKSWNIINGRRIHKTKANVFFFKENEENCNFNFSDSSDLELIKKMETLVSEGEIIRRLEGLHGGIRRTDLFYTVRGLNERTFFNSFDDKGLTELPLFFITILNKNNHIYCYCHYSRWDTALCLFNIDWKLYKRWYDQNW